MARTFTYQHALNPVVVPGDSRAGQESAYMNLLKDNWRGYSNQGKIIVSAYSTFEQGRVAPVCGTGNAMYKARANTIFDDSFYNELYCEQPCMKPTGATTNDKIQLRLRFTVNDIECTRKSGVSYTAVGNWRGRILVQYRNLGGTVDLYRARPSVLSSNHADEVGLSTTSNYDFNEYEVVTTPVSLPTSMQAPAGNTRDGKLLISYYEVMDDVSSSYAGELFKLEDTEVVGAPSTTYFHEVCPYLGVKEAYLVIFNDATV